MPLSELYRVAEGKLDPTQDKNNATAADLSFNSENDVFELVWENGQILLHGQSSKTRKNSNFNTSESRCVPSHTPVVTDSDVGHFNNTKMGKFGASDSVLRDALPSAVPSPEVELTHDDDMVPWLNYPLDDGNLHHDYASDFFSELSGVTVNDLPPHNSDASSIGKGSHGNPLTRNAPLNSLPSADLEIGNISKLSSIDGVGTARIRSSTNQLHSSVSQQCQTSFPHHRTRNASGDGITTSKTTHDSLTGRSPQAPTVGGSSSRTTSQKPDPSPPSNSFNIINFSHFLRPAARLKSNLQNHGVMGTVGLSRMCNLSSMEKDFLASSSQPDSMQDSVVKESTSRCKNAAVPSVDDNNPFKDKPPEQLHSVKLPEVVCLGNSSKNDDNTNQCLEAGATTGPLDCERTVEPVIAASVCSRNSVEGTSDDPTHKMKRKCRNFEDSECNSDDVEEESIDAKRSTPGRGSGFKRTRAAEVHNLSERRRRDRINEKMRALQELIPNCNKVDKASMLDEAIEYLKTLQLQVQIMSMGAGFFMPPMMFPGGMQPMNVPHMPQYSPMGVGMGMGFGLGMPDMNSGSSSYPIVQVPQMQGAHFPGPSIPNQTLMHGMTGSNIPVLGLPGQGLPMPVARAPIAPFCGGPSMAVNPMQNVGSAAACSSKDVSQNIDSPMVPKSGPDASMTSASKQANEQASCINGRAVNSTGRNDIVLN